MTSLLRPASSLHASWIATVEDFGDRDHMHGSGAWHMVEVVASEPGCRTFVEEQLAAEGRGQPGGGIPSTYYWIGDGEEVIGFLHLRHELNDFMLEEVGHIGYSIRPSRRREGHASRALALGVRRAGELGIDRVLVTCDDDNAASRGTILKAGGTLEDVRNHKERYWIAVD